MNREKPSFTKKTLIGVTAGFLAWNAGAAAGQYKVEQDRLAAIRAAAAAKEAEKYEILLTAIHNTVQKMKSDMAAEAAEKKRAQTPQMVTSR